LSLAVLAFGARLDLTAWAFHSAHLLTDGELTPLSIPYPQQDESSHRLYGPA
jgi:hypothetical protein